MPRPRKAPIFELAGQWIGRIGGTPNLYRFWYDAGACRTCRASLGTTNLDQAKRQLAEIVVNGLPKTQDTPLSVILLSYFEQHTDKLPSKKQSRNAGRILLKCWGETIRVSAITEAKQREFVEWCLTRRYSVSYVARNLTVAKAALNSANVFPPSKIVCAESKLRELWGRTGSPPKPAFIPTDAQMDQIMRADKPDRLMRWMIVATLTASRGVAALDLCPASRKRDAGLVDLLPDGRAQNKKRRPTVRVTRVLKLFLDKWELDGLDAYGGKYVGYTTFEGVKSALQDLRADLNMPRLSGRSFRHKAASIIRKARAGEDQVSQQLGHRRRDLRTTEGYGEFDPDFLAPAAKSLDAWALRLLRGEFAQGFSKSTEQQTKVAA